MSNLELLKRWSVRFQIAAVALAVAGVLFRATLYPLFESQPDAVFGTADVVDFVFALALFLTCTLCAVTGVGISLLGKESDKGLAFRAMLAGVLSFLGYEYIHGLVSGLV